jgi:hypothetical protein
MVFGVNQLAGPLLAMIQLDHRNVPRFRDCFLNKDGTEIIVYTRTGGGNREEYAEQNAEMTRRAGYLRDEDDSYDSTYAIFYFAVPVAYVDMCKTAAVDGHGVDVSTRWETVMDKLRSMR